MTIPGAGFEARQVRHAGRVNWQARRVLDFLYGAEEEKQKTRSPQEAEKVCWSFQEEATFEGGPSETKIFRP